MTALWWYLAGVATLPALFLFWLILGLLFGTGRATLRTTVNGRTTERTWR